VKISGSDFFWVLGYAGEVWSLSEGKAPPPPPLGTKSPVSPPAVPSPFFAPPGTSCAPVYFSSIICFRCPITCRENFQIPPLGLPPCPRPPWGHLFWGAPPISQSNGFACFPPKGAKPIAPLFCLFNGPCGETFQNAAFGKHFPPPPVIPSRAPYNCVFPGPTPPPLAPPLIFPYCPTHKPTNPCTWWLAACPFC